MISKTYRRILVGCTILIGHSSLGEAQSVPVYLDESKPVEQRIEDALARMTLDEKIAVIHAQSKFSSPGVKRLGFPDLWTDDGPHGVRPDVLWDEWVQAGQTNDSCVAFPALTCLAATWNPQMARLYGESLGEEALYRKKSVILGPGVNIYRTPLGGRNFEYMGEDPLLASRMVVPYVQGLQSKGVAACVKHYALNNDEEYRHQVNVVVSDRALHEIYLPAFKAAVTEGGAWAIMGAYNLYRNQHNCHNSILLNKILKQDWGFDGVVISDWGGCHDTDEAVTNGLDLEFGTWTDGLTMGRTNAYDSYHLAEAYKQAIREGRYTTKELDEKVRRVLRLFYRTTMRREKPFGFLCSESHYDAALRIAQEGIVLLKNDRVAKAGGKKETAPLLPLDLSKKKRILVVGENAIKMMTVGGGSSSLKVQREILPLDAIQARCSKFKAQCSYARGYVGDTIQSYDGVTVGRSLYEARSAEELRTEAVVKAKEADVVIFFGGLNKSDYQDSEGHDRRQYGLPYGQDELLEALLAVNKDIVYVNISGNAVAMPWLDKVPAVVQGWFIGSEAGEALVSVLMGDVNPSGKLPFTWYQRLEDCGAHALNTYPGTWRDDHQVIDETYKEGVYVGYRWTDKQKVRPLFAFGHGLSYTTFKFGKLTADRQRLTADEQITFTVSVTNTGRRAGSETVQLYIADKKASVDRPVKELKAFQKVFLQPGETTDVKLTIGRDALSFYDETTQAWKAEPGEFEALVGSASDRLPAKYIFRLE
ncbi:glycoside hydrolase family 3 C-terminal domain-containing protein [Prevotella sp. lc2012]|uniref:glycoside hydrolase family 3 C-terminal domain-containing protein n=1 Tax=Prevotella sp. lc2012 TaxID=1761886 RepID=UPI0008979FD4|nr:glycoside hydrolase family 3 C-terminal domain-containing protein [Prevotella sp. lc2012]SEE58258.1 beta-glucosidase [Prevotella sp. lc2012]